MQPWQWHILQDYLGHYQTTTFLILDFRSDVFYQFNLSFLQTFWMIGYEWLWLTDSVVSKYYETLAWNTQSYVMTKVGGK